MESQYAVLGKRHEADLDPSNLKDTNEESLKYSEIQLPTIHNTYAFGTNDHSNIGEMPDYLDDFLDLGLRSGYTEASLTNAPTWADQMDKRSFNSFPESTANFRQENTLTGFDSTSDGLRTTYAAQ